MDVERGHTTLGGVGSEALMQYGTSNVRMLALDSLNRPYCYMLYNVRYVPQSRVRLMATEPERLRDIHMRTEPELLCQTRPAADGAVHLPFVVRHAHYWTKGVILHADRAPVLPTSSKVSPLLRKVWLSAARKALSRGGVGSLVEPVRTQVAAAKGGAPCSHRRVPTRQRLALKSWRRLWLLVNLLQKGGARVTCSSSPRRGPACLQPRCAKWGSTALPPVRVVASLLPRPTAVHTMAPKPTTTIPMVELFAGVGSLSHYLRSLYFIQLQHSIPMPTQGL
jgi:hypothetical protein